MVREVLPQELLQVQRTVKDLEEIESQPGLGVEFLDRINSKIQAVNTEINNLVERKMLRDDPMDDKLAIFRQNVS